MFLSSDGVDSSVAIYRRVELADAGLRGRASWDELIPRKLDVNNCTRTKRLLYLKFECLESSKGE